MWHSGPIVDYKEFTLLQLFLFSLLPSSSSHRNINVSQLEVMTENRTGSARNGALRCGTCNKDFVTQKGLYMHNSSKHPSNKDKARKKPNGSGNTKSENKQNGKAPQAQSFSCTLCDKTFCLQSAMEQHQRTKHVSTKTSIEQAKVAADIPTQPEVVSTSSDKKSGDVTKTEIATTQRKVGEAAEKDVLRCEPCDRSFGSKSSLVQHNHVKHSTQNISFTCDICKQGSLPSQAALDAHRRMKHGPRNKGKRATKPNHYCYICKGNPRESFGSQHSLEKHQLTKHNIPIPVRPWPCKSCDRSFDTDSQLEHHEKCQHKIFRPQWHKFGEECARCGPMIPVCMDFPMADEDDIVVQGFFGLSCQHDDCDESYDNSEERRQHEITHHNRCLTCTGYFTSEAELKEHQSKSKMVEEERRTHLLQLEVVIRQKQVLAAMLASSGIPKEEKTKDITEDKVAETQQNAGGSSKDDRLLCRACNKTFRSTHGFDQHRRDKHNILKPANNGETEEIAQASQVTLPFVCIAKDLDCKEKFWRASVMMRHIEDGLCNELLAHYQITRIFQYKLDEKGRQLWDHEWSSYKCPDCQGRKFKFDYLADLIEHAERGKCSLDPLRKWNILYDCIAEMMLYAGDDDLSDVSTDYEEDPYMLYGPTGFDDSDSELASSDSVDDYGY